MTSSTESSSNQQAFGPADAFPLIPMLAGCLSPFVGGRRTRLGRILSNEARRGLGLSSSQPTEPTARR